MEHSNNPILRGWDIRTGRGCVDWSQFIRNTLLSSSCKDCAISVFQSRRDAKASREMTYQITEPIMRELPSLITGNLLVLYAIMLGLELNLQKVFVSLKYFEIHFLHYSRPTGSFLAVLNPQGQHVNMS